MTEGVTTRVVRGFLGLSGARLLATPVQFVAFTVMAADLGPSGTAVFTFAVALVSAFRYGTDLGFHSVVARAIAQEPRDERRMLGDLLHVRLLLGLASYAVLAAVLLLGGFPRSATQAGLVAGLLLLLYGADALRVSLEVRLKVRAVGLGAVIEALIFAAGVLVGRNVGFSAVVYLAVFVAANGVNLIIVAFAALREVVPDLSLRTAEWRPLAAAAAPIGLATLCNHLYYRLDLVLLTRIKPLSEAGQYGLAFQFFDAGVVFPGLAMALVFPLLAAAYGRQPGALQRRYSKALFGMSLLAAPVAVIAAMTAWRVIPALPGLSEYGGAGITLAILGPAYAIVFLGHAVQAMLVVAHLERIFLRISLIGLGVNIALNLVLIPPLSYIGAAVATVLTEGTVVGLSAMALRRHALITTVVERSRAVALSCLVLAIALSPGYALDPWLQVVIGLGAYALAACVTGAVRGEDLALVRLGPPRGSIAKDPDDRNWLDAPTGALPGGSSRTPRVDDGSGVVNYNRMEHRSSNSIVIATPASVTTRSSTPEADFAWAITSSVLERGRDMDHEHDPHDPSFGVRTAPVVVQDDAWLTFRVTDLPGVTFGRGAVITAGAVVTRDVAPMTIVAGVPASPTRRRHCDPAYILEREEMFP